MNNLINYKMQSVNALFNMLDEYIEDDREDEIDTEAIIAIFSSLSLTVTEFCEKIYGKTPNGETFDDYEAIVKTNKDSDGEEYDSDDVWDYPVNEIIEALNNAGHAKLYPVKFKDPNKEYIRLCECPNTERPDIEDGYILCYDNTEQQIWEECDSITRAKQRIYNIMEEYDIEDDEIKIFDKRTEIK